ncbi:MAG TPA: ABC transporter substrate-binding protein [Chloroflexota bacterium]|nr:ABC transporter substrate-binding protein [Chloroflexota bacterium]
MPATRRSSLAALLAILALLGVACAAPAAAPAATGAVATAARPPGGAPAASAAAPSSPRAPTKVRIGYVTMAPNTLPMWMAADYGVFAKYGLDVELTYIEGASRIAGALVAGDIDLASGPAEVAMGPGVQGADTVMIASWADKMGFALMGQPEIRSLADIRGKRLGVTRRGSNSEVWASAVLAPQGLEADRDYTVLAVGGLFEQIAALQARSIDVGVVGIPANLKGRELGFHEVIPLEQSVIDFADVGLVTTRRYLREQPDTVDRLLRASAETVAMIFDQPEPTLASIERYTDVHDRAQLDETLAFQQLRTTRTMLPTEAGLRQAMDELARNNPAAVGAKPEDFVDLTQVRQLNDSGFIQGLAR